MMHYTLWANLFMAVLMWLCVTAFTFALIPINGEVASSNTGRDVGFLTFFLFAGTISTWACIWAACNT